MGVMFANESHQGLGRLAVPMPPEPMAKHLETLLTLLLLDDVCVSPFRQIDYSRGCRFE